MKEKKKIIITILILFLSISFLGTISYGFGFGDLTGNQTETTALKNAGNNIVRVISTVGVVLSVVMLIVLGIKYMMGSTSEKAEYKKSLLPYVIGATLVFAASTIAQLIYELAIKL